MNAKKFIWGIIIIIVIIILLRFIYGLIKPKPQSIIVAPSAPQPSYIPYPVAVPVNNTQPVRCNPNMKGYDINQNLNRACGKAPCNELRPGYDIYGRVNNDCGIVPPPPPPNNPNTQI